ncbi:MAG: hypothetical protein M1831_002353 [Alyxoria varia]|nr:MAG: hypothetical protein M1831_002353 [Alyxoria varia]
MELIRRKVAASVTIPADSLEPVDEDNEWLTELDDAALMYWDIMDSIEESVQLLQPRQAPNGQTVQAPKYRTRFSPYPSTSASSLTSISTTAAAVSSTIDESTTVTSQSSSIAGSSSPRTQTVTTAAVLCIFCSSDLCYKPYSHELDIYVSSLLTDDYYCLDL